MNKKAKIGICGNVGSFSEEAAIHYCQKNKIEDYELVYLITAENTLSAVTLGEVDKGIFPIENSNGGIVYESVYAMAKYTFNIEKMFDIDVRHCLLVLPGKKLEDINKIASHQQALKQCKMYLKKRWPDAELLDWPDTAQAARDLNEGNLTPDTAVVAPLVCSKLYNLDVLEEGIQDLKFNFTTFIAAVK
jgi:prephenate dehydratase